MRASPLSERHGLASFACGEPELDSWLRSHALRAQRQGTARTYVWESNETVTAYFSLAPTLVRRSEVAAAAAGGNSWIPGYLLARLALNASEQGRGAGSELLVEALEVVVRAADAAGGRLVVVDAVNESARAFYLHHDFRAINQSLRLYMKIATAKRALGLV